MEANPVHKKILFCWFQQAHLQKAVGEFLTENKFDFVGLMGHRNYLGDKADIFLHSRDTRKNCHFPDHGHNYVPSRKIIEEMRGTEAEVLKMMDRIYRSPFKPRQYEFRKRLYYSQLCMAYGFIMKHGFDRVIFSNIPHNSFDFILFGLCESMGIETSFLYQLQIKDCFLHAYNLSELYDQLALPEQYKESTEWKLPDFLEEEIQERLGTKAPFYMSNNRTPMSEKIKKVRKKFFRIQTYTYPFYTFSSWFAYRRIPKYKPTTGSKFVYFALHMQPEATTSPMGGVFVDQYYVILMIARALPEGTKVVVKEHPHQEMWQRTPDFYNLLHEEPNVEFVSLKQNSFELIKQSIAVATITGTVGWEALFLKKPVILFGHIFYKHLSSVINVNDTESLAYAINQILSGDFKLSELGEIRALLHHTNELAYTGAVDDDYFEVSHLTPEQNKDSVKQALNDFILK